MDDKTSSVPLRQAPSSPTQSNQVTLARCGADTAADGRGGRDGFPGKRVRREPLRVGREAGAHCQQKPGVEACDEVQFEG